ncbi:MAG: protein translocase subunit SecF [Gammaproteobacteria bacterium]|nr:protein translocase subunit SecF [Gammaproteobacteria bacterium]
MEFFHITKELRFMRHARTTSIVSAVIFLAAVVLLVVRGLNLGIEFTGGTMMEVRYPQAVNLNQVRNTLEAGNFRDANVQNFGTSVDVLIRLPVKADVTSAQLSEQVLKVLRADNDKVEVRRVEFVGPQVGAELVNDGGLALILVSIGIMIYLAIRFEWRFAVGAIVATAHDLLILLGLFSLFQWEFTLTVLAAMLAVLGYSVNDTVVVFDRIRENFRKMRKGTIAEIIDSSITSTLSRTIMTSATTLIMVFAMLFLGGEILFYFALTLAIGIAVGTYSSVLVASPIVMWLGISRADMVPVKKEGEIDDRP